MKPWETYAERINNVGVSKRDAAIKRGASAISSKVKDSLSYQTLNIDDVERNVAVINSDNLDEKTIISMPGEDLIHGGLVHWMDNFWLITERDANTTLYTRAKMVQCNHLLKWITEDGVIHEHWCIVEDGTKYLSGELEDRNFIVTRGDSRIAVTVQRNADTLKLGRQNRFLIDDVDSPHKLAYTLSKPLKLGNSFNNAGVFKFVLQEVTATEYDNHELGIADYFKYIPKTPIAGEGSSESNDEDSGSTEGSSSGSSSSSSSSGESNTKRKGWL